MDQQIAYCTTADGVRIAYATYGNDDAPPLLHNPELPGQEAIWASPWGRRSFEALVRKRRLITFDLRCVGASQREADCSRPETVTGDIAAVVDHLRLDRFEMFTARPPCATVGTMYAAAHPERVSKLVLFNPQSASRAADTGNPAAESARASLPMFFRSLATFYFPSGPPEAQRWFSTSGRASITAADMAGYLSWAHDLTPLLPLLTMPVLILYRKRSQMSAPAQIQRMASLIPDARLVTLDGDAGPQYWEHEQFMHILDDFLGIEPASGATLPSGTAVILFTDIAGSTAMTERLGDGAFRDRSRDLDATLREAIRDGGGSAVEGKLLGDGVMAVFASARQAIDCAVRCRACARDAGLELHLGVHAGDVIREEGNVYGGAVNIASRICEASAPGEILVSDTVRALARTSADVTFEDRGERDMKGVSEPQRLFAVRPRL